MRPGNRSRTSDWVAGLRALYTEAPPELAVVDDAVALRLLPASLALTLRGASVLPFGTRVMHRAIGSFTRGLSYGIPLRTAAIDEAIRESTALGIRQLVLLGAGLDARAWRMPELAETIVFEVDHPDTQTYKRERTGELSPLASEVRFCAIDFERETIGDVLSARGFDASARSVWVWEGVTMYLSPEIIEATVEAVADLAAPDSRLIVTYLPENYGRPWMRVVATTAGRVIGEPLKSTHDPAEFAARLASHGFVVETDSSAIEWADRRWPEREARRVRAFERLAIARRVEPAERR